MLHHSEILGKLDPGYFWDVDHSLLDVNQSSRLIIERVFSMGSLKDIRLIIEFYGEDEVLSILQNVNYLDRKTLNFVSKLFNAPLNTFKCYRRKQLMHQHWHS